LVGGNGVLSVQGDFDEAELRALIEQTLAKLPKREFPLLKSKLTELSETQCLKLPLKKEQVVLVIGYQAVGYSHEDYQELSLLEEICNDMSSRLFQRIREELGLAYYVGSQYQSLKDVGGLFFYVGTSSAQVKQAEVEMFKQIEGLVTKGVLEAEIKQAKVSLLAGWMKARQSQATMCDVRGNHELFGLGYDYFMGMPERVNAVKKKRVDEVIKKYLKTKGCVIIHAGDIQ
jgi:zinc protease